MAAAADTDARATGASEEHPLRRTWVLWELREKLEGERYRDTLIQLFEFSTAEEFWRKWHHAPRILDVFPGPKGPSKVRRRNPETGVDRTSHVSGYQIFEKGIHPTLEFEVDGVKVSTQRMRSDRNAVKRAMDAMRWDEAWETAVLAVIGESLPDSHLITGVNIFDKTRKNDIRFRLEVWLRSKPDRPLLKNELEAKLEDVLKTKLVPFDFIADE